MATNDGVDVCVDFESFVGVAVSVDFVEKAFAFFLAAFFFSASSASMAANFIMASRKGFSFSMAGDGGEGLGEQRLLMPLDDSTIIDWTRRLLVAKALRCASELLPFLRTTRFWLPESESELFAAELSVEAETSACSSFLTSGGTSVLPDLASALWLRLLSLSSTTPTPTSTAMLRSPPRDAAVTLGDADAGGGLSQTELEDDPHGDGDDEFDDNDVTPLDDVDDVRLSFVGSSPGLLRIGLSSEMDLKKRFET